MSLNDFKLIEKIGKNKLIHKKELVNFPKFIKL